MSDAFVDVADAMVQRVPVWARPVQPKSFVPWSSYSGYGAESPHRPSVAEVIDPAAIREQAFAQGMAQGRAIAEAELAAEQTALAELAASLAVLQPETPAALGMLLSETVERLVRQVIGEVAIDRDALLARAQAAAALIAEETAPSKMRVHPEDQALLAGAALPLPLVGDPHLARGTILIETGSGWIEDGPAVRLEKLRSLLDRLGAPE